MSREVKITCDNCERDITYTSNSVEYRIIVDSESMPHPPTNDGIGIQAVTAMMVYPPIKETLYYCQFGCLKDGIAKL